MCNPDLACPANHSKWSGAFDIKSNVKQEGVRQLETSSGRCCAVPSGLASMVQHTCFWRSTGLYQYSAELLNLADLLND